MRFGAYLFAAIVLIGSAGASDWREPVDLPAGGLPVILPGFSFHSPGAGWQMMSDLPPKDGVIHGENRMFFLYAAPTTDVGAAPLPQHLWADIQVGTFSMRGKSNGAVSDIDSFTHTAMEQSRQAYKDSIRKTAPQFEFFTRIVNGVRCAGWKSVGDDSGEVLLEFGEKPIPTTEIAFVQYCPHPDLTDVGIRLSFNYSFDRGSKAPAFDAVGLAVLDSLNFIPVPFRVRKIQLRGDAMHMAEADGSVWVAMRNERKNPPARGSLVRIDPATNAVIVTIALGTDVGDIAATPNGLWAVHGNRLSRIDPKSNAIAQTMTLPHCPFSLIAGGDYLWALWDKNPRNFGSTTVARIDPRSGRIDEIAQPGGAPRNIIFAEGALFIEVSAALMRFDPVSLKLTGHLAVEGGGLQFDGRYLWALVATDRFVSPLLDPEYRLHAKPFALKIDRIDLRDLGSAPVTVTRYTTPTLFGPYRFAWWGGKLCMQIAEGMICIDPQTLAQTAVMMPMEGFMPGDMLVFGKSLWVTSNRVDVVTRLDPK